MGTMELCWLLDCRLIQHRALIIGRQSSTYADLPRIEYLDDIVVYDRWRIILVAVVALCMDWLFYFWFFHLHDWPHRRHIPYQFSRCEQGVIRNMGFIVACL